jgi:glycosyl-4,4'-diaponeurosporenoate acyltransferase
MIPLWAKQWGLWLVVFGAIALLCWLADSANPAFAFALAWGPNYPLFGAAMLGALRLPRFLEPVHPVEPALYRAVGVGLIKRLVTTRAWLILVGLEPPPKPASRRALLDRIELWTKGAEIIHIAAFAFASSTALFCLAVGATATAAWILAFNLLLNGYPVMLQRSIRRRVQLARANERVAARVGQ